MAILFIDSQRHKIIPDVRSEIKCDKLKRENFGATYHVLLTGSPAWHQHLSGTTAPTPWHPLLTHLHPRGTAATGIWALQGLAAKTSLTLKPIQKTLPGRHLSPCILPLPCSHVLQCMTVPNAVCLSVCLTSSSPPWQAYHCTASYDQLQNHARPL